MITCPMAKHLFQFRENTPSSQSCFKFQVVWQYVGWGEERWGWWSDVGLFSHSGICWVIFRPVCSPEISNWSLALLFPDTRFLHLSPMSPEDIDSFASLLECHKIWRCVGWGSLVSDTGELFSCWETHPCSFNYFHKFWSPTPPLLGCE